MSMQTFSTYAPVFTGFYNTIFDESDRFLNMELDDEDQFRENYEVPEEIPWDFITDRFSDYIDHTAANKAVAEYVLDAIPGLYHKDLNLSIEFEELRSPREYNFANDSIDCKITLDIDELKKYLDEHKAEFDKFLRDRYTGYSGFISSYPNSTVEWAEDTEDFTALDGHYLGAILDFIAAEEHDDPQLALYYAANGSEAFMNAANVDIAGLIQRYQETQD